MIPQEFRLSELRGEGLSYIVRELRTGKSLATALLAMLYVASVSGIAVALHFLGKPQWFGPTYWTSIPTLFLIECYLLRRRFGTIRHLGIRYTAVTLASALLTLVTVYIGITIVLDVFGPLGWI